MSTVAETRFLNRLEAARFLGVSPGHLRNLEAEGSGPPVIHLGKRVRRYKVEALERYIEERTVSGSPAK